jgi:hypothetical protein
MKAIELWDATDGVFLTLGQVLAQLPERATLATWDLVNYIDPTGEEFFETGGNGTDDFDRIANTGTRITGDELIAMAQRSSQVIWATFHGRDSGEAAPWISMHAIDSSFWRIETSDTATRQKLMKSFRDVRLKQ